MGLEGSQIGRYQILHLLGSGAMGDVYLAEDPRIGQQVAIKVIRVEPGLYPDVLNAQEAARLFQREIQAIVKLDSPHILPLYDYGEQPVGEINIIYLVMPYRKEGSLAKWLSQRNTAEPLSPQEVADLVGQVAEALQHAHNRQIIHRDVKPSNILLRLHEETATSPDLLLADFGIAQLITTTSKISQSVRGTPTYMAPEQWAGEAVPASDQYALAIMTYELLTGDAPFRGSALQVMYQHMNNQPPAPGTQNPRLAKEIDWVLLRALAKKADERFASVSAFARALQEAVNGLSDVEQDVATVLRSPSSEQDVATVLRSSPAEAVGELLDVEQDISTVLKSPPAEELRVVLAISEVEAQTGTIRTITLPGGREVTVTLPAGIQHGSVIRLGEQNSDAKDLVGTVLLSIMIKQEAEVHPVSDDSATALLPDKQASTDPTTMLSDKQAPTVSTAILQDQVPGIGSQQSSVARPEPDTDKILMPLSAAETSELAEEERGNLKGPATQAEPPLAPTPGKWLVRGRGNLKGLVTQAEPLLAPTQRTKRRMLFAVGLVALVLLLIGGSVFIVPGFLSSTVHDASIGSALMGGSTSMTVVTITPARKELQHSYTILAVIGTPDSAKQQIAARQLTSVTAAQSQTAQATGISTTAATHASGTLTLYNYSTTAPITLSAGMEIANMQSTAVDMILDAAVTAPPGQDASNPGTANVPAHVAQIGPIGNLPPVNNGDAGFYFCTNCPNGNVSGYEIENDAAFSGGQNGQTVTTVQQSDIDNAANTLESANEPNAQQILQGQIRSNERLINAAQCRPNVSSNHGAGEQASSVTVMVTFSCTGEVYDQSAALALAQQLFMKQAKGELGLRYALQGSIVATVARAILSDAGRGTITLTTNASGTWVAHFDDTDLQALAVSLAGKTKQEAQAILSANKDVARFDMQISGGNGDVLPMDVHQIRMVTGS